MKLSYFNKWYRFGGVTKVKSRKTGRMLRLSEEDIGVRFKQDTVHVIVLRRKPLSFIARKEWFEKHQPLMAPIPMSQVREQLREKRNTSALYEQIKWILGRKMGGPIPQRLYETLTYQKKGQWLIVTDVDGSRYTFANKTLPFNIKGKERIVNVNDIVQFLSAHGAVQRSTSSALEYMWAEGNVEEWGISVPKGYHAMYEYRGKLLDTPKNGNSPKPLISRAFLYRQGKGNPNTLLKALKALELRSGLKWVTEPRVFKLQGNKVYLYSGKSLKPHTPSYQQIPFLKFLRS